MHSQLQGRRWTTRSRYRYAGQGGGGREGADIKYVLALSNNRLGITIWKQRSTTSGDNAAKATRVVHLVSGRKRVSLWLGGSPYPAQIENQTPPDFSGF